MDQSSPVDSDEGEMVTVKSAWIKGFGFKTRHRRHEEYGPGVELDGSDGDTLSLGGKLTVLSLLSSER